MIRSAVRQTSSVALVARACRETFWSSSEAVKYAMPSIAAAGRWSRSTVTVTGTVQRAASADSAGPRPRSVRIAGWMPRARSRSSWSAIFTSPCASSTIFAAASGSSASFSLASPRSMASETSRA